MTRVLAISDLDRTLIYSASAAGVTVAEIERTAVCVEHFEGRPLSYMTAPAAGLVRELVRSGRLVPATTRTMAQALRVVGPFAEAPLVICANGGRLLRGGAEDRDFSASVDAQVREGAAPVEEAAAVLRTALDRAGDRVPAPRGVRIADDLFCYVVLEQRPAAEILHGLAAEPLSGLGWSMSVQGRKCYAVPRPLSKWRAAARVRDEVGADQVVAAGDSLLDQDLLVGADLAIRPAHGELHDVDLRFASLAVTAGSRLAAGEEIARWLADRTRD
jgi:hypothetical protein